MIGREREGAARGALSKSFLSEAAVVFSSMTFLLLFLPIVLLLYFSAPSLRWKNAVLLLASLLFYAWGEPVCVLAMLFSAAVNYFCAAAIVRTDEPRRRKAALTLGVGVSLALLFYFKYFSFALENLAALFSLRLSVPQIRLPIGISFYTFQVLTYTVDVYRGKTPAQKSFPKLLLYVSCFPQLIAGPIVQYADVAAQLDERSTSLSDFNEGIERFVTGLAKKVLLANICGAAVEALPNGGAASLGGAWYHAFLYTLQIYFDFSAYSDMAIGLGQTLGFRYKENFRFPYASLSVTEFWRRWHISLGSFFRDYVYIPMGGNRRHQALNILVVWFLTGLWHGASWNFVIWGVYFGIIVMLEKYTLLRVIDRVPRVLLHVYSLLLVIAGWGIFYFDDFGQMTTFFHSFFGQSKELFTFVDESALTDHFWLWLVAILFCMPVRTAVSRLAGRVFGEDGGAMKFVTFCSRLAVSLVLLALSVSLLVGATNNAFIYTRF
jgi:alginate O-acetyltransferase complex protein AlgI